MLEEIAITDKEHYLRIVERVYTFVMCSMDYYMRPHNYGNGQVLSMVEMHTLSMIAETPGLRVTDVAKMWNRTLGAATKNINKLEQKGYILKRKLAGNKKSIHLYPTEEGMRLAELHKKFDSISYNQTLESLLQKHSREELLHFANVLETLIEINKVNGTNEP